MENKNGTLFTVVKVIAEKEGILFHHLPNAYSYDVINFKEVSRGRKLLKSGPINQNLKK